MSSMIKGKKTYVSNPASPEQVIYSPILIDLVEYEKDLAEARQAGRELPLPSCIPTLVVPMKFSENAMRAMTKNQIDAWKLYREYSK